MKLGTNLKYVQDPDAWSSHYSACGGDSQSPIDIQPQSSILKSYPEFKFHQYESIANVHITNNGHTG